MSSSSLGTSADKDKVALPEGSLSHPKADIQDRFSKSLLFHFYPMAMQGMWQVTFRYLSLIRWILPYCLFFTPLWKFIFGFSPPLSLGSLSCRCCQLHHACPDLSSWLRPKLTWRSSLMKTISWSDFKEKVSKKNTLRLFQNSKKVSLLQSLEEQFSLTGPMLRLAHLGPGGQQFSDLASCAVMQNLTNCIKIDTSRCHSLLASKKASERCIKTL